MKIKFSVFFVSAWLLSLLAWAPGLRAIEPATAYFPLKEGITWEFSVISGQKPTRKIVVTSQAPREINGVTVYPRKWDTGGAIKYYLIAKDDYGVYRYGEQTAENAAPSIAPAKVYYLKEPVDLGTTWDIETKMGNEPLKVNLTIEGVRESVQTPAGVYKDCAKIKHVGGHQKNGAALSLEAYEWYAPRVGLVKSVVTIKQQEKGKPAATEHQTYQLDSFKP